MTRWWVSPLSFEETNWKKKQRRWQRQKQKQMQMMILTWLDDLLGKNIFWSHIRTLYFLGIQRCGLDDMQKINTCGWLMFFHELLWHLGAQTSFVSWNKLQNIFVEFSSNLIFKRMIKLIKLGERDNLSAQIRILGAQTSFVSWNKLQKSTDSAICKIIQQSHL